MYTAILFIGLALAGLGLWFFLQSYAFVKKGIKTMGTVVDVEETKDSDGSTMHKPIFRYTTQVGEQQTFEGSASGPHPDWFVGDEALIVYDPDNPGHAKRFSYFGLFGVSIVVLMVSTPFIVVGLSYFAFEVLIT